MHNEHQPCLSRSLADVCQDIGTHHWQVLVARKATLEESFYANTAGTLDRGYVAAGVYSSGLYSDGIPEACLGS
jgi:hypothetical protein